MVNDSKVYGCILDASKAFDHVDHLVLFKKLLDKHLPPFVVRLLLMWDSEQRFKVRWKSSLESSIGVSNGVVFVRIEKYSYSVIVHFVQVIAQVSLCT